MLVLEAEAIEFEGRRRAVFETLDHGLAAARITAHRIDGDRIVRRHQPGIHERPHQRYRAGRIAAWIPHFPPRAYLVPLTPRNSPQPSRPAPHAPKCLHYPPYLARP